MNTKIRFIEIIFMLLLIISFGATGIFIMSQNYDYAMISLVFTSFVVLVEFYLVLTGTTGKVIDLRGATKRGKQAAYGTGEYGDKLYDDEYGDYGYSGESAGFSSEGVGNMRVYQRGEQIDYADSEEDFI